VEEGWWNLCSDGTAATLSFYSTPETIRGASRHIAKRFSNTKHLTSLLTPSLFRSTKVRACGSSFLHPCAGAGWMATGDAVMTFQPLASAGIARALEDASLSCRAFENATWYNLRQQRIFQDYLKQLSSHYALEKRWPKNPFWTQANGL
jgi:flavin-dependent dehydrogenase